MITLKQILKGFAVLPRNTVQLLSETLSLSQVPYSVALNILEQENFSISTTCKHPRLGRVE